MSFYPVLNQESIRSSVLIWLRDLDVSNFVVNFSLKCQPTTLSIIVECAPVVISSIPFIDAILRESNCVADWKVEDGEKITEKNKEIVVIKGKYIDLLPVTDLIINVIRRSSSIATYAEKIKTIINTDNKSQIKLLGPTNFNFGQRFFEEYSLNVIGIHSNEFRHLITRSQISYFPSFNEAMTKLVEPKDAYDDLWIECLNEQQLREAAQNKNIMCVFLNLEQYSDFKQIIDLARIFKTARPDRKVCAFSSNLYDSAKKIEHALIDCITSNCYLKPENVTDNFKIRYIIKPQEEVKPVAPVVIENLEDNHKILSQSTNTVNQAPSTGSKKPASFPIKIRGDEPSNKKIRPLPPSQQPIRTYINHNQPPHSRKLGVLGALPPPLMSVNLEVPSNQGRMPPFSYNSASDSNMRNYYDYAVPLNKPFGVNENYYDNSRCPRCASFVGPNTSVCPKCRAVF